jgi:protein-tyrosine phosphatase
MSKIDLPDFNIFLGGTEDLLNPFGFNGIISILTENEYKNIENFIFCDNIHFEVKDNIEGIEQILKNILLFIEKLNEWKKNKKRILLHCQLGKSRSPTFLILYMIYTYNFSSIEAFNLINNIRKIKINPYFWELIDDFNQYDI